MGEKIFKLISLIAVMFIFTVVIASPKKNTPKNDEDSEKIMLSHIGLAAQVNDFNQKKTDTPPSKPEDESQEKNSSTY